MEDWEPRFWAKVDKNGPVPEHCPELGPCWVWTSAAMGKGYREGKGYGLFGLNRRGYPAHRLAYQLLIGDIPDGLQLDHVCRNTRCVNPAHLEPVTHQENVARFAALQTHCKHGHPLPAYVMGQRRICLICRDAFNRQRPSRKSSPFPRTHCRHGHPYLPENTYIAPSGKRMCRTCMKNNYLKARTKAATEK